MTQQCMGGWCTRRDKCVHYWAKPKKNVPPPERLCGKEEVHTLIGDAERAKLAADPRFGQWTAGSEA